MIRFPATLAARWRAALFAIALGTATTLNAQGGADPRIGSWDELQTSSHYDSLRRVLSNLDNGMIRLVVNDKLLEVNRWHVDFRCDGAQYRILNYGGKFVGITYACRRTGARTFETWFTYGPADPGVDQRGVVAGRSSGTGTEEVSADGRRYRTTGVARLANGTLEKAHREFSRRN